MGNMLINMDQVSNCSVPFLAPQSLAMNSMASVEVRHLVRTDPFSANGPHLAAEGCWKGPERWRFWNLQGWPLIIEEFAMTIMVTMTTYMAIGNIANSSTSMGLAE